MFYTKEVPIDSIIIVDGTSPRTKVDNSRVAFFRDIYLKEEDPACQIPPVEVSLVQTGEPGKEVFALEDGMHRLLAQKEIKLKKIQARIRTGISISEAELSSYEVKRHLLLKACESNARHGMPLSTEERKEAVQKMNSYGCTNVEIIATGIASKATVYRWLQSEVKERKETARFERDNKKELVVKLLMEGASVKKIMNETGIPRTTVRRMLRDLSQGTYYKQKQREMAGCIAENSGRSYEWMQVDDTANNICEREIGLEAKNCTNVLLTAPEHTVASGSTKKKLDEIYDAIRSLEVSDAADHEIKITILPLFAQKFPGVAKIIRDGGYAMEMEALHYELKAAKDELQLKRKELLRKNDLIQQRDEQLKKRTEVCNYHCEFTTERLRQEFEKYVNFMISNINEHIQVIPHISTNDGVVIRQLTTNNIFALLSVLEWGDDNGLTSLQTREKFEELKDCIIFMDMNNKSIDGRMNTLEENYLKMSGMLRSFS